MATRPVPLTLRQIETSEALAIARSASRFVASLEVASSATSGDGSTFARSTEHWEFAARMIVAAQVVPEPGTALLLGIGLVVIARRRHR